MKKKNETPVEEIKQENVEEVKPEEAPETKVEEAPKVEDDSHIIYINKEPKPDDYPGVEEVVENERKGLFKTYRSTMTRNNILLFVVAAVFITGFIIIPQSMVGAIIGWSLIGVTVIGMVVYYIFNRKLYPNKSKHYIRTFWQNTNDYLFAQDGFKDCYIDTTEVYKTVDIAAERVYDGIIDSASRNLVHGKYNGKDFTFGELALYKAGEKKKSRAVLFIGRHLSFTNDLHFEGRYIITSRGAEGFDLANDISDLSELYSEGNIVLYGNANAKYEKEIDKALLKELEDIRVNAPLLNINIVLWAGRTSVYLSYDDSIVAVPLENAFNKEAYDVVKSNIKDIFRIVVGK